MQAKWDLACFFYPYQHVSHFTLGWWVHLAWYQLPSSEWKEIGKTHTHTHISHLFTQESRASDLQAIYVGISLRIGAVDVIEKVWGVIACSNAPAEGSLGGWGVFWTREEQRSKRLLLTGERRWRGWKRKAAEATWAWKAPKRWEDRSNFWGFPARDKVYEFSEGSSRVLKKKTDFLRMSPAIRVSFRRLWLDPSDKASAPWHFSVISDICLCIIQ